jgi:hypothetical protein
MTQDKESKAKAFGRIASLWKNRRLIMCSTGAIEAEFVWFCQRLAATRSTLSLGGAASAPGDTHAKTILALLLVMISPAAAWAHPGWGIVQDSKGNVYFTDTRLVWKVSTDGRMSVAVPNVHTHELCIDAADNLYGEHLWYVGGASPPWKHRVWHLRPDGSVSDVIPTRDGFLTDYSFVRDRAGNMYWADRGQVTVIKKRSASGAIKTHAAANFRSVERMTAMPDGTLFLMDAGDLRRVSPAGRVTTIATALTGRGKPAAEVGRLNSVKASQLWGLCF